MLVPTKFTGTKKIVKLIKEWEKVVKDQSENFIVDGTATGINVLILLYDLQQPTKKIPDFFKILKALISKEDFVIDTNAKIGIRKRTHWVTKQKKKNNNFVPKRIKQKKTSQLLTEESSDAGSDLETSKEGRTQQEETNWESFDGWEKLLKLKRTKGPAAFGSVKNLNFYAQI